MEILPRFNDKYTPEPNSGCWLWTSVLNQKGYGLLRVEGRFQRAHRVSYELFKEPIPNEMCVLHKCDTPSCVNPDHLFIGTQKDNMHDMHRKGRGPNLKGSNSGKAKITEDDVRAIRADNRPHKIISQDYPISVKSVTNIRCRSNWPWVK